MQRISHLLRRPTRAGVLATVAISAVALLVPSSPSQAATDPCGTGGNAVACENTKTGNPQSEWDVAWDSDTIEGFASGFSYNVGDRVDFKVKTTAGSNYAVDIYRMGYYQGNGARKMASVTPVAQNQPNCLNEATTGLIDCGNWKVSASWTIPTTAVSGVYFAHVVRKDNGEENHIVFVVRNDASTSNILFQTSDTTWQAYNNWGGNSLYTGEPVGRAYKVSYNRPFNTRSTPGGRDFVFANEMPMIRFMERNGYDVSYFSGMDADRKGALIKNHKLYVTAGHDEYWSGPQRNAVEAARDAGVNMAFFTGNDIFWKTRWENAIDGSGNTYRTLVTYKSTHDNANTDPTGTWTGTWRDIRFSPPADGGRPENSLSGTFFTVNCCTEAIKVPADDGKMRFWRNTNIATQTSGQVASLPAGTLGYEWNEDVDNGYRPAGLMRLSTATYTEPEVFYDFGSHVAQNSATHHLTMYKAASGARVFSAGTVQWAWGLDDTHDGTATPVDTRMQQATVNLFADQGVQPVTLMTGMVAATPTTDTTAPSVTITSPAANAGLRNGTTVTVTGTATDSGGQVAGVEVSTDNGATWHPANGRGSWTYSYDVTGSSATTIKARAVDDSGNLGSTPASVTVNASCPCVFFGASQTPKLAAATDSTPTELGMRFTSSVNGYVTGVRFYKASTNTGTHTGSLWSSAGTKLASVTFSGESTSGWQTATFASAVPITAGTDYVVSYYAPNGHYMADNETFAYLSTTRAPLTSPKSTDTKPNGIYRSGSTGFPTDTYKGGNYWVDPVVTTVAPPDTTAPTVLSVSPANGASSVPTSVKPAVTFSEPVQASTIVMTLKTSTGTTVAGTVALDSGTNTATFTPSAALANNTAYTVSVSGAKDTAGNTMASALTSSFTTVNPNSTPGVCPCTIWDDSTVPGTVSVNDPAEVEVGVKFRSTTAGLIKGVRFYKGATNTGTHIGTLWSSTGTQLATGTFSAESTSGWQTLTFATPVQIVANTTYVASYHTTTGFYSADAGGFSSAVTKGPLTALRDGDDGGNGVYKYGVRSFPSTGSGANYYVDVVYDYLADTTAPTVTGVSPGSGATGVAPTSTVRVTYSEKIASGIVFTLKSGTTTVAGTGALSTDGTQYTFTPSAALASATAYTATISGAKDAAGNTQASALTWSFTTSGATGGPSSLFSSDTTPALPAASDTGAVELGMKFTSSVDGYITAIKFYKGSGNTGTHTGSLWSSDGTKLGGVTFTNETTTGWQTATLAAAVPVQAGKTYVVSYFAPVGRYAADSGGFTNAITNAPLSAPSSATSGGNGVYAYNATSKFPSDSYASSNYYVDVVFTTIPPADTTAPSLVGTAPANGQTGVPLTSTVKATFDEALQTSPLSMTVTPAGGTAIGGTVGYDATTRTVVFSPAAALTANKQYTAVLNGVKDAAGNTAATVTWTFTTGASSSNGCPCTIWPSTATPAVAAWNDPAAIEVGVKFRATTAGTIKGIRFYKGATNTGTHVGRLYSSTGTLLASATFAAETASGWQEVLFSTPVTIAAGTTYVATYYAPSGNYAATAGGLSSAVTAGPLTALANGTDGANGVYRYGTGGGFPTSGNGANYWVDVLFQ